MCLCSINCVRFQSISIDVLATAADGFNLYLASEDGRAINFVSSTSKEWV